LHEAAVARADWRDLGSTEIRLVQAPHFAATKLEAFRSRGAEDYYASHGSPKT
jgi:predicted nucleotidyltransferase